MDHKEVGDNINAIGHLMLAPFWILAVPIYLVQRLLIWVGESAIWLAERASDLNEIVTYPAGNILSEARKASMRARSNEFDEDI